MIDFNEYKKYFDDYAARYDHTDGRVALKIVHTYAVVSVMETLCRLRCLPPVRGERNSNGNRGNPDICSGNGHGYRNGRRGGDTHRNRHPHRPADIFTRRCRNGGCNRQRCSHRYCRHPARRPGAGRLRLQGLVHRRERSGRTHHLRVSADRGRDLLCLLGTVHGYEQPELHPHRPA